MRLVGLVFCLFMGVTALSLGVGAIYPPINRVAQPVVCPDGELTYQRTVTHPLPGRTYVSVSWACTEPSGRSTPIRSSTLSLSAGAVHGLLLYALLALGLRGRRLRPRPAR